ncbi:MAG: hypothetical protein COA44_02095 [Arcobacter sp.]|nr:MAG: hypothetical protein COA44_02095 [Arcobacter sp.]
MKTQKRLEEKFKTFISMDDYPYFTYIHDNKGVFTYLSDNVTLLLGFSPDEFKKSYLNSLTPNTINRNTIINTETTLITGKQQDPYQIEIYDKHLNRRLIKVYESPVIIEGKVEEIEGVAKVLN